MTLDSLSRAAQTPKASLLRLLHTLGGAGLVAQDPSSRRWTALARIVPLVDDAASLRASHAQRLDHLLRSGGQVVELYVRRGETMHMVDRREPADAAVTLRAQVGFVRDVTEVEAVAQLLLAWQCAAPRAGHRHWRGTQQVRLSQAKVRSVAVAVRRSGCATDLGVNPHGVRRIAAPLVDAAGDLVGAIAIAALGPAADATHLPRLQSMLRTTLA